MRLHLVLYGAQIVPKIEETTSTSSLKSWPARRMIQQQNLALVMAVSTSYAINIDVHVIMAVLYMFFTNSNQIIGAYIVSPHHKKVP